MLEGAYKTQLTKRIEKRFRDRCFVTRLDANVIQGIPDLLVLFKYGFWAALEGKRNASAPFRPNQQYYVDTLGRMCFAAFIYPENEEAVLNELEAEYQSWLEARFP